MSEGNRLIEVLVIIIILVIVIAMLIPNLLSGRTKANEKSAIASLRQIASAETLWYQQDPDGNGIKDYWTYDVFSLYRAYKEDPKKIVAFLPLGIARADIALIMSDTYDDNFFGGTPMISYYIYDSWHQPISGYWFSVMITNNLTGQTDPAPTKYNVNPVGDGTIKACNSKEYAFMAAPDVYDASGSYSFIINELGIIYGSDTDAVGEQGSGYGQSNSDFLGEPGTPPKYMPIRWTTDGTTGDILAWPTKDPTTRKTKSGNPWKVAD